jgi:hypothetical protein
MKKCRDCESKAEAGKSMCRVCLDKVSARMRKLRKEAIAKGLCGKCRINDLAKGETRCEACIKREKKYEASRRKKYISEGKCSCCGTKKDDVGVWYNVRCTYCHLKYKFEHTGTREEATQIVNNILEKQNYRCALTGRDLRNNKFHIDHITPKSKGGLNTLDNWQLIVEEANVFKTDISMEEIIKLARDIAKWHKIP